MFSTTSSSSFQQLASPRLLPRPSSIHRKFLPVLKIARTRRPGDDKEPRFLDETFLFVDVDCVFFFLSASSRGRPRRRRLARNDSPLRALHLGGVVSFTTGETIIIIPVVCGIVRPSEETTEDLASTVKDVFSLVFPLFPLFPLFATAGAQHVRRDSYSRSLPSRSVDLPCTSSRDVPPPRSAKGTKARRRPWYLSFLSLSLSLFRAK